MVADSGRHKRKQRRKDEGGGSLRACEWNIELSAKITLADRFTDGENCEAEVRVDSTVTGRAKTDAVDGSKKEREMEARDLHISEVDYQLIRVEHVPSS